MPYPQGAFSGDLDLTGGGLGQLLRFHIFDPGRHLESLVFEELTGTVGGGNKVFWSSRVPRYGKKMLFLRGQLRYEPADYVNEGHGTAWVMERAPNSGDPQPFAVYFNDPSVDELDLAPEFAGGDFFFEQASFAAGEAFIPQGPGLSLPWLGI